MRYNVIVFSIGLLFQKCTMIVGLHSGIHEKQRKAAYKSGDFIIGALFSAHRQPRLENGSDPLLCGEIREHGIQRIEAALFATDCVNNDQNLLPGITLGINIKDDCWSESVSLHQAMQLIQDPVPHSDVSQEEITCSRNRNKTREPPLIGIMGPGTSSAAIQVENFLKLFQIPQISYAATSAELFDVTKHQYFLSLVPNDLVQALLMLSVLKKFNWTYVSVIYVDNNYGHNGKHNIETLAHQFKICIAKTVLIPNSNNVRQSAEALDKLSEDEKARVVVCFCDESSITSLLKTVKEFNYTGKFLFLGSDSWGTKTYDVIDEYKEQAWGSLIVSIDTKDVSEFDQHYIHLNPRTNTRNPWFTEFWENKFHCTFNATDNSDQPMCTGTEKLGKNFESDGSKISYVIESVYAFAHALHNMQADICKKRPGLCDELYPFNSVKFMTYLRNVNFTYQGDLVTLTQIYMNIRYNIYNFQKLENGEFAYVEVGKFQTLYKDLMEREKNGILVEPEFYQDKIIQFPNGKTSPFMSVCAIPCEVGQIQIPSEAYLEKQCCWICIPCKDDQFPINKTTCEACDEGYWPFPNKTGCYKLPEIYSNWTDLQSLVSLPFSIVGLILTLITSFIFIQYKDTPVVKSSTRELCYIMLFGMITVHCSVFAVISKPSFFICTAVRAVPAISFTMIYASLLVKTNRIARILAISKKKFPNLNPRFMSLRAQIIITLLLIVTEILICAVIFYNEPSLPVKDRKEPKYVKLLCPMNPEAVIYPFLFNGLLVTLCTMYAFKTRYLPENFNEAKFIGFAMYVSCITWIAFVLVYYGSDLKVLTTCICGSINSMIILICLFFPKLYIIIWVPERNTRAHFSTCKGIRCIIGREESSKEYRKKKPDAADFAKMPEVATRK